MSLTAADVAEIMRLVEASVFDELTLDMNGMKLSLRRGAGVGAGASETGTGAGVGGAQPPAQAVEASPQSAAGRGLATAMAPPPANVAVPTSSAPPSEAGLRDVPSPLLGTFYRAPRPGAAPFVEIGGEVTEDTSIGIIEVMKLMTTVRAGVSGIVAEILPADGTLVEYGQTLLRVRERMPERGAMSS